jgi:integrase
MKSRKGYVYQEEKGIWYARFTYTDNSGKRRNVKRRANNKTHGDEILKELIREFDNGGAGQIEAAKITFNDLCDFYEKHYVTEAKYVNNRKVSGLRSVASVRGYIKVFRQHFGRQKLKDITYEHLRTYRNERLGTSTHQSKQRSLATVNREMAYLRRLLNIAERNGWINKNPFKKGDALIHASDEVKRQRFLTHAEEQRLLAACFGFRSHLRPLVIAAIDTGCRFGELIKLRWTEVDFDSGIITIQAFNTKTMRERQVSITSRLMNELEILQRTAKDDSDLVFGIKCEVRIGFRNACKEANLEGVRFHDLRHTHASRLDDLGFSLAKIGGQLRHTVMQTTLRYVNRDKAAILQVASALNAYNGQVVAPIEISQTVN